ncbi:MAG: RdgB/HAM1 family non-canonical purine NTP pyrophosphatase [Melioribacteraceae bacterium]|nr:RdgB/HAM1 family non-canonical purine NTP pyrophosphatase [Melioribacteraceae bacterium]MCF8356181.1 RdgB/HAM1 family non-canonical purine NTP pyrophosphatase [Melioribacteraceae bacterium]MCF8394752.1 RdgB/HAM1 family non-canonical purine NTP pyrophosphatase [Melioribacteraceae bacterium]MCF8417948.1 RdgB/HAM1 family non-canonical purine NTP pyrophosphatase [Melioribacteraceae bacterium]
MKQILFATGNKGKLKEVRNIFLGSGIEILSPDDFGGIDEIEENGNSFEENSILKARIVNEKFSIPTIADDSGLSVEQLEGRPGIYSARYAGENCTFDDNNHKLINELKEFSLPHHAKFVCFAVYFDGKKLLKSEGFLHGKIIDEFRGEHGFGYDPIFIPDGFHSTLAEIELGAKNKISHRSAAFTKLKEMILNETS